MKAFISAVVGLTMLPTAFCRDMPGCAHIRVGAGVSELCQPVESGHRVYVVNEHKDKRVRVTVRRTATCHGLPWQRDDSYEIPAGGEKFIGCERYSDCGPVNFEIVGCEVL